MRWWWLWATLAGVQAVGAEPVFRSDFAHGPGGFKVVWTGHGALRAALDPARPGPGGAPSWHTVATDDSTGTTGTALPVGAVKRWRLELWATARAETGAVSVALKCLDAAGHQVDWIGVGGLTRGEALHRLTRIVTLSDRTATAELLILHENFRGESWIADIKIDPFELTPEMAAKLKPPGPTRWGATGYLRVKDPALADTECKLLVAAGVTHTRLGLDWRRAEPERGRYDFTALDQSLATLARYGARADVVFLHGTPSWASGKTKADATPEQQTKGKWYLDRLFWPPRDWSDWERFVAAVAAHFRGRVPVWEIMNEPDIWQEGFCGQFEDYVQYLSRASRVAKRVDPGCRVYCAAMVRDGWLAQLIGTGHTEFDGVCIHPYHSQPDGVVTRARSTQLELLAAGLDKPLMVTEMGYQSGAWKQGPAVKANEAEKAACGAAALAGLREVSDFICWYTSGEAGNMYGLLRDEQDRLRPMPIYYEYGQLTGALRGDGPVQAKVAIDAAAVTLTATNTSAQPVAIKFWPVGFTAPLGAAAEDWQGSLAPGERRQVTVQLRPAPAAKGNYPLGLAVIAPGGNALALGEFVLGR